MLNFCKILITFSTCFASTQSLAQNSFNPTPIDRWAEILIHEINSQIEYDEKVLAAQNLTAKYNRFAANQKYAPVLKFSNLEAQKAYDRKLNRNDNCFGGVIDERLNNTVLRNCNFEVVNNSCFDNQALSTNFVRKYSQTSNATLNNNKSKDALAHAKQVRFDLIVDLKHLIAANKKCSNQIESFQDSNLCADSYSEVLEPIRNLIKSTCTENAVQNQIAKFKLLMSNKAKRGYADQFFQMGNIHIQSRKAEIQLAKYLISINNLILGLERGSKAPVDSPRPQMRETSSLCDPARKTCQGANGG